MNARRILLTSVLATLVLGTSIFAFVKMRDLIFGIPLHVESPKNGSTLTQQYTLIEGEAPGATLLTVAGVRILPDVTGRFKKELLLGLGYNVVEVAATDRFNRTKKLTLELMYKPQATSSNVVATNIIHKH